MSKFLVGEATLQALYDAGLIDDPTYTRRVIFDFQVGFVARVYVDKFADDRFLELVRGGGFLVAETEDEAGKVGTLRLREEDQERLA